MPLAGQKADSGADGKERSSSSEPKEKSKIVFKIPQLDKKLTPGANTLANPSLTCTQATPTTTPARPTDRYHARSYDEGAAGTIGSPTRLNG